LEDQSNWEIVYAGTESTNYAHFDAFVAGNKLYVYLMENTGNNTPGVGDKRPLYFQEFNLSEIDVPVLISLEAENYTTASSDINVGSSATASGGQYIDAFSSNQFIEHKFPVTTAGTYDFILYAANRNRHDSIMDIEINGTLFEDVLITRTFDWNVYLETKIPDITLNQGENTVRITQRRSLSSEPDKIEFQLKSSLSTNDFTNRKVLVYPNPSKGVFNIQSNVQKLEYTLVNTQGQILDKGKVLQNQVDFSKFSQGVYFLKLTNNNDNLVKRIVIK
jgi:hypothetical protein